MGIQPIAERPDGNVPNDNIDQRRPRPREESPWLRDQRRAPRSVRTHSPFAANEGHGNSSTLPIQKRRQRPLHGQPSSNPFDSPSPSARSSQTTTPASRNPSPSDDNRMLYTLSKGSSQPRQTNPFGSSPTPRPLPKHRIYTMQGTVNNNPFDSPDKMEKNATRTGNNPFESPNKNPFDSPQTTPTHQESHSQQRHHRPPKMAHNPFDSSTSSSSEGNAVISDSPSYPQVRVTVTEQHASPRKQQGSVALDSLEQILDTTEDTVDEGESDDAIEDTDDEGWSDEPHHKEQQREQQNREYNQQHPRHLPSTSPPAYFSPGSQQTYGNSSRSVFSSSDDGTHTTATPSEKALRAAETLKKSFEQRRRQKATGIRSPSTILEGTSQEHDDLALDYSRTEEGPVVLGGVAGKRRAEADAKNAAAEVVSSQNKKPQKPTSQHTENDKNQATLELVEKGTEEEQVQEEPINNNSQKGDYTLHDLCDEAIDTDDLAWRNALFLLSVQPHLGRQVEPECNMTPLHVACLAQQPPPVWITRGLLYAAPETCSQTDTGGRLPLHLLVATSAHVDTIRLLVEEYPPGVAHRDDRGFTPLQLLLKRNDSDGLTLEHLRLLLGQQLDDAQTPGNRKRRLLFRNGDHLRNDWVLRELESLAEEREQRHESAFREYPDDVRRALTKLSQWKRRQVNKQANARSSSRSDEENHFLRSREADFVTPASISTPTGQLLPLHLLVRRNSRADGLVSQDIHSVKKAKLVDLLRVLISAYPQGLVGLDANGKTPIMTAMLQPDTSPNEEVVELLLGLRTPGFDGRTGIDRPALLATGDTFQMPLHVAAEELLSKYSLLSVICGAYPDARTAQDVRGRTPLHLAFQNYRSVPVNEMTLELLFVEPVAKIKDNDGKTPLDLLLENPGCVVREVSDGFPSTILQEFFDASIERPRNRLEAEYFLRKFQSFPPWLRREACAARFVQDILVEEIASPFTTFRILGSGIVLALLLLALRRMLHMDPEYAFLIYYLATYHLIMQIIQWGIAIYMGEFFRLCIANIWRWIDLGTAILSTWCAIYVSRNIADISDVAGTILLPLGASATISCWLSLLGYFVEWSCGLAVFIGSAMQLLTVLVWPLCIATMGFFAVSQVLFTLQDCIDGGICSISQAYTLVYLTTIGQPVLVEEAYEISTEIFVIILLFTIACLWWIVSVIAMIVTEASRLDRRQLSFSWYWEPKATLTVMTSAETKGQKISDSPSLVQRYCDTSEKFWHIFASALRGEKSHVHWDAFCFRSTPMLIFTGFLAFFVLPIWIMLGLLTLGLLWPPQIRRWLFHPRPANGGMSQKNHNDKSDLMKSKLSKLRNDLMDLKAITKDQNNRMEKDLGLIKDVIFRAVAWDNDNH